MKTIDTTADCPQEIVDLFQKEYRRVDKAIRTGDYSEAQFPRVGAEAAVELHTRRDVMQWVLEMLNACEGL